jgi:hypothetical protein
MPNRPSTVQRSTETTERESEPTPDRHTEDGVDATLDQDWQGSSGMGDDHAEPRVLLQYAGENEVRDRARGLEHELKHRSGVGQRRLVSTERRGRVDEDHRVSRTR